MQPITPKENFILCAASNTLYLAWSNVYALGMQLSNINDIVNTCCVQGYNNTLPCEVQIVKSLGAGISVRSTHEICNTTLPSLKNRASLEITGSIITGLVATAITVAMIVTIAKRYINKVKVDVPEMLQSAVVILSGHLFVYCVTSRLMSLTDEKGKLQNAINLCCVKLVDEISAACLSAATNLTGQGFGVSTIPDLCGSGLRLKHEENRSSLIGVSFFIAMMGLVTLGILSKSIYDCYYAKSDVDSPRPSLRHSFSIQNDLEPILEETNLDLDLNVVELSSDSSEVEI